MKKSLRLCGLFTACLMMTGTLGAKAKPAAASTHSGQAFHKGAFYLGGALGLGSGLGYLGGFALIANAEYAATDNIGIGGSVGYWSYTDEINTFGYKVTYKYSIVPIIVSGAWHFHVGTPKLDLGAGVSLGYYVVSASSEVSGGTGSSAIVVAAASGSGVAWGIFGLVRYFVTDRLALRGKLGYGITVVEAGVDFRL